MFSNGNSFGNGGSVCPGHTHDAAVLSLPWLLRVGVPGMVGGWPA
jgi:hypothetical protein